MTQNPGMTLDPLGGERGPYSALSGLAACSTLVFSFKLILLLKKCDMFKVR